MALTAPLDLPTEEAKNIEDAILALQPFSEQSWESAIENYLMLRWMLGLGTATAKDIFDGLERARFWRMSGRPEKSCLGTVYRVLDGNKFRDFRVTSSSGRGWRWIRYHPRQYAWSPSGGC